MFVELQRGKKPALALPTSWKPPIRCWWNTVWTLREFFLNNPEFAGTCRKRAYGFIELEISKQCSCNTAPSTSSPPRRALERPRLLHTRRHGRDLDAGLGVPRRAPCACPRERADSCARARGHVICTVCALCTACRSVVQRCLYLARRTGRAGPGSPSAGF